MGEKHHQGIRDTIYRLVMLSTSSYQHFSQNGSVKPLSDPKESFIGIELHQVRLTKQPKILERVTQWNLFSIILGLLVQFCQIWCVHGNNEYAHTYRYLDCEDSIFKVRHPGNSAIPHLCACTSCSTCWYVISNTICLGRRSKTQHAQSHVHSNTSM